MKTKIKLVLTIQIIVIILLASNLQAKNTLNIVTDEEPSCIGHIYGSVGNSHGIYAWEPYIFAFVDAKVKQTRTGLLGVYHLFLPLNNVYQITAFKSGFKPLTKEVNLTDKRPVQEVNFDFFESEPVEEEEVENSKPTFYGFIVGITGGVFEYASWFVSFTKLSFENRTKISGFFGFYIIGRLEIGKEYKITASKEGYSNLTQKVTLTAEKPIKWVSFFMYVDY